VPETGTLIQMEISYIGEQLIFGKIGNLLIATAFCGALLSALAYFFSFRRPLEENAWKRIARTSFLVHGLSVLGIFLILYYLIFNHKYEYYYVWQHSNTIMPAQYIFASFWEGQEGSFLIWTFWHIVLSLFLIRKGGVMEGPTMVTIGLVQAFLMSMVLGVHILGHKIGTNPFVLLREHPDMANLPFVQFPDYLQRIDDGRGLNPLLQNYWMVIHPPVLFLGFASTLIPFAMAMGGLMTRNVHDWTRYATPWSFFGIMTLGAGILMGAAWAYEALSFGGFWAWDPVENASLVPWLTFVGAAHVMMINKKNGSTLFSSLLLTIATFILVLYSTFLTRSGILGDTSVHAFTDLGMTGQLVIYMGFFIIQAIILLFLNRKSFTSSNQEDSILSREFWMFIGVLVIVISGVQITFTTSIPVINKIFGTNMAPPANVIDHYNSWQIPFAVIICLMIGFTQFLKYRQTNTREFFKRITPALILTVITGGVIAWQMNFDRIQYYLLLFASLFAVYGNLDYAIRFLKGKLDHTGASVAHVGVALILLGSLISNANSQVISRNILNIDLGEEFPNNENIMLFKGDTLQMANYFITYSGKEQKGVNVYYNIDYLRPDFETGKLHHEFTLKPTVQLNPRMGNVSEPDTRHFLTRDIYTHVTYADLESLEKPETSREYLEPVVHTVAIGDTISASNALILVTGLSQNLDRESMGLKENDIAVGAELKIMDVNKKIYNLTPVFTIRDRSVFAKELPVEELGLKIAFRKIDPETGKIDIAVSERKDNKREFIIMKAIIFPYINILWTGCILLVVGSLMAIRKRFRDNRRLNLE
jgi:cytochrome c-type biogenesis protein CcmF